MYNFQYRCTKGELFTDVVGLLFCLVLSSAIFQVSASSFDDCWSGEQDIVMIIDGSGSIKYGNFTLVKAYIKDYISKISVDDGKVRVGIVLFSYSAEVIFKLNTFNKASDMMDAVDNMLYPQSWTNTASGLRLAREELLLESEGDRPEVPNIVLLVVDGYSNVDVNNTIPEATLLKDTGCRVVGVSIGNAAKKELDKMASLPLNQNRIDVADFASLPSIVPNTLTASCVSCLNYPVDLAFLIDSSFSVGKENFQYVIDYVVSVTNMADTSEDKVKVAAVTYSTFATVHRSLSKTSSTWRLLSSLSKIPYTPGWSNLAAALRTLRTEVFTSKGGDRPEVVNVALLISDGRYNIFSEETVEEALKLREEGVYVLMVGVGMESPETARDVVTHPVKDHSFTVSSFQNLLGFSEVMFPFFCEEQGPPPKDMTTTTTSPTESTTTSTTTTATTTTTETFTSTSTAQTTGKTSTETSTVTFRGSTEVTSAFTTTLTLTRIDKCHAWCEVKDTKDPDDSFEKNLKDLRLPKKNLSKQRRAKKSVPDASREAMGGGLSFIFLTPLLFFVGWDLLDAIRYLSGDHRRG